MIYLTGDVHGDMNRIYKLDKKYRCTKDDYILICGDFGFIWNGEYKKNITKLKRCTEATILFIDGNHENFDLLEQFPTVTKFGEEVGIIDEQIYWLKKRGGIYKINNHMFFCFGGARSIDKSDRKAGVSWWPQEEPTQEELIFGGEVINKNLNNIEYVITHDCPEICFSTIYPVDHSSSVEYGYKLRGAMMGWLAQLFFDSKSFKHWYCGHHHINKELKMYKTTFLYGDVVVID